MIGGCQWCGKQICRECVGKTSGKKAYCKECSGEIGTYIERRQLEQIRREKETEKREKKYAKIFENY